MTAGQTQTGDYAAPVTATYSHAHKVQNEGMDPRDPGAPTEYYGSTSCARAEQTYGIGYAHAGHDRFLARRI